MAVIKTKPPTTLATIAATGTDELEELGEAPEEVVEEAVKGSDDFVRQDPEENYLRNICVTAGGFGYSKCYSGGKSERSTVRLICIWNCRPSLFGYRHSTSQHLVSRGG